ncbi:uncharacterized protein LOC108158271 [Drosophila miranda]|uniref:uncharacterized protein LOC108158271 n=1 Tax=Drosophila miranda TaxID=7229 RepID=UPI00143F3E46|nr:uncharacterized protein LOC108158271 [Drosophila miranda]
MKSTRSQKGHFLFFLASEVLRFVMDRLLLDLIRFQFPVVFSGYFGFHYRIARSVGYVPFLSLSLSLSVSLSLHIFPHCFLTVSSISLFLFVFLSLSFLSLVQLIFVLVSFAWLDESENSLGSPFCTSGSGGVGRGGAPPLGGGSFRFVLTSIRCRVFSSSLFSVCRSSVWQIFLLFSCLCRCFGHYNFPSHVRVSVTISTSLYPPPNPDVQIHFSLSLSRPLPRLRSHTLRQWTVIVCVHFHFHLRFRSDCVALLDAKQQQQQNSSHALPKCPKNSPNCQKKSKERARDRGTGRESKLEPGQENGQPETDRQQKPEKEKEEGNRKRWEEKQEARWKAKRNKKRKKIFP